MSLAIKPLLPPPPDELPPAPEPQPPAELARASTPGFEPDRVVQDVLAHADPSLADAVREFVAGQPPIAVVTESAEPVYVNEKRDTLEATPLANPVHEATASVIVRFDDTAPVAMPVAAPFGTSLAAIANAVPPSAADTQKVDVPTVEHEPPSMPEPEPQRVDAEQPEPRRVDAEQPVETQHEPDKVAQERGIAPLRMPKLSAAFVPIRDAVRSMSSRAVVITSVSIATVSVGVAVAAVMWARGAVADSSRAPSATPPTETRDTPPSEPPAPIATLPAPQLIAQPPATPGVCVLTVRASSPEAIVSIDGTQVGVAPQTITGDCNRTAKVEVRHPRYAAFEREVAVDGDLEIDARLEREKTELTVWSEPAGAEVVFEGRVLGKTPLTTTVNRYETGELIFNREGYQTDWRRIVPKQAKKTVAITLKKAR